jgi:Flp pilus assembly protein protease CpaA
MRIAVFVAFFVVASFASLASLRTISDGAISYMDLKSLLLTPRKLQITTYIFFFLVSAVMLLLPFTDYWGILTICVLVTYGYIAAVSDYKFRRIPNKLSLIVAGVWLLLALSRVFGDFELGMNNLRDSIIGMALGGGLSLLVYLISRKGLGAGDVKFLAVVGLYVRYQLILAVILVGCVFCTITAICLILAKKRKAKDALPLAPFLYFGILLTIFLR